MEWSVADVALIVTVTAMGVAVAYLENPQHKATVMMLPVPFTLATLAVGRPIDVTNVIAIDAFFGYWLLVWLLRMRLQMPILVAIPLAVFFYCICGLAIAHVPPTGDAVFWITVLATMSVGTALVRFLPPHEEPHHRTPLPVWIKAPTIAAVVCALVQIKHMLAGFTTVFPMVGVVAAYESRYSLWTIVRRMAWLLILMPPMMATVRLLQPHVGMPFALLLSWPVILVGLWFWHTRFRDESRNSDDSACDVPRRHEPMPEAQDIDGVD